jgi:hypothetical protein
MAIFRGVGGSGDSSDNSFLQEVTAQANAASASATAAANSATSALNTELTSASFNTSDGVLTLTKQDGDTVTADLDGRFLTSYTETDPVFTAHVANGITATNISNWNTAYNNHITAVDYSGSTLTLTQQDGGTLTTTINGALGSTLVHSGSTKIEAISSGVTVTGDITVSGTVDGRDLATDGTKLDGIETSATADQTDAEIKTAYENNADTNAFTDADHTKLDGIEAGATGDQSGAEIKTAYEAEADTNAFTDAEKTKLSGIEANATADQTGAEIKSAYEAVSDTNAFTDAEKTKLSGIEASADVTDTANVTSAGALMTTGGTMSGNITCNALVTVDGRNVSADGTKLDTIATNATANPYYRVSELRLAAAANWLYLNTTDTNLGQATNIYHPSTPENTTRLVDIEWSTYWDYVNSNSNDIRLTLQLVVPSGVLTKNLGTVTEVSSFNPDYGSRASGQKWYYVSGDVSHYFTQFGRMSQSSSGSLKHTIVSSQYDSSTNRTYFCLQISTANMVTGNTAYWHSYAWESASTLLTQSHDISERFRSGYEQNKVSFKLPFSSGNQTFRLKIKELASGDAARVRNSVIRLTSMGV